MLQIALACSKSQIAAWVPCVKGPAFGGTPRPNARAMAAAGAQALLGGEASRPFRSGKCVTRAVFVPEACMDWIQRSPPPPCAWPHGLEFAHAIENRLAAEAILSASRK